MTSRPVPSPAPHPPTFFNRTRIILLILIFSSSLVILFAVLYFIYHLWRSLLKSSRTIPFDSSAPLKLERFTLRELKNATNDFSEVNIIGKGGSGTVFRGIGADGKLFAVKKLDNLCFQTETEFQNELQILGGLRSPFLVSLLGYCAEKDKRLLVYEYMPNRSLQELLFSEHGHLSLTWDRRFSIILDIAKALEFLHFGCDPPVIHGDVKPSNVLLDAEFRAKISDFGLSRIKVEGELGVDLGFSQDLAGRSQELWKSQDLSCSITPVETPVHHEVDFALALQSSCSSKNSKTCSNAAKLLNLNSANYNANIASDCEDRCGLNPKGKEVSIDLDDTRNNKSEVLACDDLESCGGDHPCKDSSNLSPVSVLDQEPPTKQWGKDWWWKQDGNAELRSKDYVREWIGSQICQMNSDWDLERNSTPEKGGNESSRPGFRKPEECLEAQGSEPAFDTLEAEFEKERREKTKNTRRKKHKKKKMQEWWKEERMEDVSTKSPGKKWKGRFKILHFDLGRRFCIRNRNMSGEEENQEGDTGEFSFRRGWRKKNNKKSNTSEMCSGDLFSRELSSTTSMRGTLCYVAPEYGGCGYLVEKGDIYSLGVLILVIISGRRPLHVLASPMKLEKANLISWCRHLAQSGNVLELVDERIKDDYDKEQASLCINLALICLQKIPELRPDIGDVVRILKAEMELPPVPMEFSPSPISKFHSRSRRKPKENAD